jgi:hypothetical protein
MKTKLETAAPELLAALQAAVDSLEWASLVIGDMPPRCEYLMRLDEARALIKKVRED